MSSAHFWLYLFACLFLELKTKPRAPHLLGKLSTTELNPQPPSAHLFFNPMELKKFNLPIWQYIF